MASEFGGIETFGRTGRRRQEPPPGPRSRLGVLALGAGLVTVALTIGGILTAMSGGFSLATLVAYLATGTSVVAVLCGAAAVLTRRGRGWGGVAILLGLLASPPLLTRLLAWVSGLG